MSRCRGIRDDHAQPLRLEENERTRLGYTQFTCVLEAPPSPPRRLRPWHR